jgi:hypothetical protein
MKHPLATSRPRVQVSTPATVIPGLSGGVMHPGSRPDRCVMPRQEEGLVEPTVTHAHKWLNRYALFDSYADLAARRVCTLAEALDSYLWELGYAIERRRLMIGRLSLGDEADGDAGGPGSGTA